MKIFAFTDLHGDLPALKKLKAKVRKEKPDIILAAGDISVFSEYYDFIIKQIDSLKMPFLLIHGNHESEDMVRHAANLFANVKDIHKKYYFKNEVMFLGYGGGGFSLTDPGFVKAAKKFEQLIRKYKPKKIVLVTHAPPYKTKVDNIHGSHAGNKSITDFIKKVKPDLVICGHLHENEGVQDKIGKTLILNPGFQGKLLNL